MRRSCHDPASRQCEPEGRSSRPELERALKLHCRFQGLYDRTFCKLAVRLAALLAGAPFRDQQHLFYPLAGLRNYRYISEATQWRHPVSGEQRQTSVDRLADTAVRRITTLFKRLEALGTLTA